MKIKKILLISIIMLFILIGNAYAATGTITVTGDSSAKAGEEKKLIVKISSDEDIGLVSGKIRKK